jgi:NADH-quinone oxidoreductase subunit N
MVAQTVTPIVTPTIEWAALWPVVILALGAVLLLTFSSLVKAKPIKGVYAVYTVVVAGAAMAAAVLSWARVQSWTSVGTVTIDPPYGPYSTAAGAIGVDGFGIFVTLVICVATILGALLADDYLRREGLEGPELYVLMLLAAAGGVLMAMANDLVVLFLALETLSLAVYVLAAMHRKRAQSQEAGLKYFVLGAFSSAFFLYGIAMIYGATGTTNLVEIKDFLAQVIPVHNALLLFGFGFLLVGLAFKVSAVPFHSWSPDVYDGSPTPVAAFMASGVKAAAFAGLIRVFILAFGQYASDWQPIIYALAVLSMVGGAVLGMVQTNVKRALAYSSISHVGFILMAVEAASPEGVSAALFYLATYTFMVAGSFGIATLAGRRGDGRHSLDDYHGFSRTNPALAAMFVVFLLAQAGVPFTSGFVAKFYTVVAAVDAGSVILAVVAVLSAVVAAMIYLRIIIAMYMSEGADGGEEPAVEPAERIRIPFAAGLGLVVCLVATIGFGLLPNALTNMVDDSQPALVREAAREGRVGSPVPTTVAGRPGAVDPSASSPGPGVGASSGAGGVGSSTPSPTSSTTP